MKLSEKIKFIRKNILNLSIEEFASILGVSRKTISSWENKQVLPAISNIISISLISNITIDSIIFDDYPFEIICEDIDEECYMALKTIVKEYEKNN